MAGLPLLSKQHTDEGGPYSVDDCLILAGGWARFQRRLVLTLGACTAMVSIHMLQPIFLVPLMDWPLSQWQRGAISSVFFMGYGVGVFTWAGLSDRRGRRRTIIWAFALGNTAGICSFFTPSYSLFIILRFVCGFGVSGAKNAAFLLATEFAPPSARAQVSATLSYFWLAGLLFLVATARVLRESSWRWLVMAHVPGVFLQLLLRSPRALPESPRFHLVAGEVELARDVLSRVFATNGRAVPEPLCLLQPASSGIDTSAFAQLFRPKARFMTMAIGVSQLVCTLTFYAITFSEQLNRTVGDLYLGALLGAFVEFPVYVVLPQVADHFGRRLSYKAFFILSAVSLFVLHLSSSASGLVALSAVLTGRFASVAAVTLGYVVAAEIFPTSCRNSGIGWATGCGRLGAMIAPAIMMGTTSPLLIIASLCLVAAVSATAIPELTGMSMVDVAPADEPKTPGGNEMR